MVATNAGGGASPPHSSKRGRGRGGGAVGATVAAIKAAASSPARTTKKPPGHVGMPPTAETMDGLEDGEELVFEPYYEVANAETDGQPGSHSTAEVLKCLYENLVSNAKPTKAQVVDGGARERTSSEIEGDAQRVEEQLLALTPLPQDF